MAIEKKVKFKVLDEISGKMKTFDTHEEMVAFASNRGNKNECLAMYKLVQDFTINVEGFNHWINIDVYAWEKASEQYRKMDFQLFVDFSLDSEMNVNLNDYTYSYASVINGNYENFKSINKAMKHWFFMEGEEEPDYDGMYEAYHGIKEEGSCRCGGAGACIECNPSMFL